MVAFCALSWIQVFGSGCFHMIADLWFVVIWGWYRKYARVMSVLA